MLGAPNRSASRVGPRPPALLRPIKPTRPVSHRREHPVVLGALASMRPTESMRGRWDQHEPRTVPTPLASTRAPPINTTPLESTRVPNRFEAPRVDPARRIDAARGATTRPVATIRPPPPRLGPAQSMGPGPHRSDSSAIAKYNNCRARDRAESARSVDYYSWCFTMLMHLFGA